MAEYYDTAPATNRANGSSNGVKLWADAVTIADEEINKKNEADIKDPLNAETFISLAKSVPDTLFGPQDDFYRSLQIFCDDLNDVPGISWYGNHCVNNDLRNNILARNALMQWVQERPHIAEIPIKKPLIVCGLPRTGSTLLYHLLAQDPLAKSPDLYEMGRWPKVVPPFSKEDPQYEMLKKAGEALDVLLPGWKAEYRASHPTYLDWPEEDAVVLDMAGIYIRAMNFPNHRTTPFKGEDGKEWWSGYQEWMMKEDKDWAYTFHKRFLQVLQDAKYPGINHWNLKSPAHNIWLEQIIRTYPDANLVFTHRSPVETVPSMARFFVSYTKPYFKPNTNSLARTGQVADFWVKNMCDRQLAFKAAHPERKEAMADVHYRDLIERPIEVVKELYKQFGYAYTEEFEVKMKEWIEKNPQGKHGRNPYSLEEFALTAEGIEEKNKVYIETCVNIRK